MEEQRIKEMTRFHRIGRSIFFKANLGLAKP